MKNIRVTNFGQIKEADINFGDLTLFIGPQATGKSILLQLIKLLFDGKKIKYTFIDNGFDLGKKYANFQQLYFGEGMNKLWNDNTQVKLDKKIKDINKILTTDSANKLKNNSLLLDEKLFLIPAQRVLTIENGWPRPFSSFEIGDPYVLRDFSEKLRSMIGYKFSDLNTGDNIYPNSENLTEVLNDEFNKSIFHGASVKLKVGGMRKQMYLDINNNSLPFMAWSSGQREFMPLLLSFYWVTYIKTVKYNKQIDSEQFLQWIVIEEPEMGLHPQAILSVILMCLELLNQGYKLIISTHSPVLLEAVWAIRFLQRENPDIKYLYQLFDLEPSPSMTALFENILKNKTFLTYYFDQQKDGVYVKDISSLDPGNLDDAIADWGGLTSFSSRASEVVSQAVQEKA
ncbi:MAG: AAA family ATPase [Snowella sp.]|nr:AAA family ATPase [Snowella sp.]